MISWDSLVWSIRPFWSLALKFMREAEWDAVWIELFHSWAPLSQRYLTGCVMTLTYNSSDSDEHSSVCTEFRAIHPITAEIFQSGSKWRTDQHCGPWSHAAIVAKNRQTERGHAGCEVFSEQCFMNVFNHHSVIIFPPLYPFFFAALWWKRQLSSAEMLTSSDQSLSHSLTPSRHSPSSCGPGAKMHIQSSLSLPEPEAWRKSSPAARHGLAQGARSSSLQVPHAVPEYLGLPPRAASFDVPSGREEGSSDQGSGSLSPHGMLRRRGGLVEQKDIIMAHQAHKIQSTPQARRKEWE